VGGCTELFDSYGDGTMLRKLDESGVDYPASAEGDAYGLLPKWLHPRKAS
jgi:cysteine synthase A